MIEAGRDLANVELLIGPLITDPWSADLDNYGSSLPGI